MKNKLTKHHLYPKSKGWTNNDVNILRLKDNFHRAFHMVFENKTPDEQI